MILITSADDLERWQPVQYTEIDQVGIGFKGLHCGCTDTNTAVLNVILYSSSEPLTKEEGFQEPGCRGRDVEPQTDCHILH